MLCTTHGMYHQHFAESLVRGAELTEYIMRVSSNHKQPLTLRHRNQPDPTALLRRQRHAGAARAAPRIHCVFGKFKHNFVSGFVLFQDL